MRTFFLFLSVCFALALNAQKTDTTNIENLINTYLESANKAYRFNGVALVYTGDSVLLNKGYGYSNFEKNIFNQAETKFPILSVSKTITASVILKLQDEGKLSVNDNIKKYLPDYPNGNRIKIRHLLTHSSGIYNYTNDISEEDSLISNYPLQKEFIVNHFKDKPSEFKPGKYYSYNNSGYFLLGLIIEKVTGIDYEDYVRKVLFEPLGMNNSGFDFQGVEPESKAQGYRFWNKDGVVPYKHYHSSFAYSAGNIYSTSADMLKWGKTIMAQQFLTETTWKEAFKPRKNSYAYGWQTGSYFGNKYIKHSGGYPGYMSEFVYYPDKELLIILLNNYGDYEGNIWASAMGISSILFNLPYDNWGEPKDTLPSNELMKQYTGVYSLNNKTSIEVIYEEAQLYVLVKGMPKTRLQPFGLNQFYIGSFNSLLTFEGDYMYIREHGSDTKWKRDIP